MKQNNYISNTLLNIISADMLYRKCFVFVLEVIQYNELLEKHGKLSVAMLLLKSGTALGVFMNEAKNAGSDEIMNKKIKSSLKEAERTRYWLQLCKFSQTYPNPNNLIQDIEEISELISNIQSKNKQLEI